MSMITKHISLRCVALRLYVEEINKNIPRSVGKLEPPEPPFGRWVSSRV
jgi:hypothetical protein